MKFIKKFKGYAIFSFVAVIIIMITYKIFNQANIDRNNWLLFWGGFLSFYGTIFLSIVAIKQNKVANEMVIEANEISKKLISIEENRYNCVVILYNHQTNLLEEMEPQYLPNELLGSVTYYDNIRDKENFETKNHAKVDFYIKNHGESILNNVDIFVKNTLGNDNLVFSGKIVLAKNEYRRVYIYIPNEYVYYEVRGGLELCSNKFIIKYKSSYSANTTLGSFRVISNSIEHYQFSGKE